MTLANQRFTVALLIYGSLFLNGVYYGLSVAGETEVLGENFLQRHFVHHKSHLT
jgi:hypothetical protein